MSFTQLIEVEGVDEQALHQHVADWDAKEAGLAPGYLGARVLADSGSTGRHLVLVDFSSEEEARANDDRPETQAWAGKLADLARTEPSHRNLRQVCTTYT